MPLETYWHDDMRLFSAYQKAYYRDKSFTAWQYGNYNCNAFGIIMANSFAKKGTPHKDYPKWVDPIEKYQAKVERENITKDNLEERFRNQQSMQNAWLHNILVKK